MGASLICLGSSAWGDLVAGQVSGWGSRPWRFSSRTLASLVASGMVSHHWASENSAARFCRSAMDTFLDWKIFPSVPTLLRTTTAGRLPGFSRSL